MKAEWTTPVVERDVTLTMTKTQAKALRELMKYNITIPKAIDALWCGPSTCSNIITEVGHALDTLNLEKV